ncbi:MAG: FIST N-terminal domain-containing protein, partial [Polyangiaceae bacterium]
MAGRDAAAEILTQLARGPGPASSPDVVLAFVSCRLDPRRVLDGMWSLLPPATRLIGCSSMAEVGPDGGVTGSVSAAAICFSGVEWDIFSVQCPSEPESSAAGRALAERMLPFDPSLVLLFSDGPRINNPHLLRGMREILGEHRRIAGGVASDMLEFAHTFELLDRDVLHGSAVALAMRGTVRSALAAKAGFQPVGHTRTVTRVEDERLILELDGVSALTLYKELLGSDVVQRPRIGAEFPLAVMAGGDGDPHSAEDRPYVLRVVRELDEERGALVCGGDIRPGAKVRLTRAVREDLLRAAAEATAEATAELPDPALALVFTCA